jgi:hypothetical protein
MPYTVVLDWPVTLQFLVGSSWPPGVYLLVPVPQSGPPGQAIPLVVRDDSGREPLLVKESVFTWAAYNDFGGYSLYHGRVPRRDLALRLAERSRAVDLRRPLAGDGYEQMRGYDLPLVPFVERLAFRTGLDVAYTTDLDVDRQPSQLLRHAALVSGGHSEYWTGRMLDAVTAARNSGVNLAFLGANNVYWRARLTEGSGDPKLVAYKSLANDPIVRSHPADATIRWQSPPLNRDPSSLLGQSTSAILVGGDYVLVHPPAWLVSGTGLEDGSLLLDSVGNEADAQLVGRPFPPNDQTVAAAVLAGPRSGQFRLATANYYTTQSGAGVFSAGTTDWVCDLDGSCPLFRAPPATISAVDAITANLLTVFGRARAGARYPSSATAALAPGLVTARYANLPIGYYAQNRQVDSTVVGEP